MNAQVLNRELHVAGRLLNAAQPGAYAELQADPMFGGLLLKSSRHMGAAGADAETEFVLTVWSKALRAACEEGERATKQVLTKLQGANRWQLFSEIGSLISTSTLVVLLAAEWKTVVEVAVAVVAFACSASALAAQHKRRSVSGGKLDDEYLRLVSLCSEGRVVAVKLEVASRRSTTVDPELEKEAQRLVKELTEVLGKLGLLQERAQPQPVSAPPAAPQREAADEDSAPAA